MRGIPNEDTLDAAWMTEILQRAGVAAEVVGMTRARIGTGQIGKCIRYQLEYAVGGDTAAPASVIVKYPSDDETSRTTGVLLQNFLKEVRFYQELQARLAIRTPRCFYAEIKEAGPEFAVVMEDLAPARQGDQLLGCDAGVAHAAVMELVGLHAPGWCDTSLRDKAWLFNADVASSDALRDMYRAQLPGFIARYGEALAEDEQQIFQRLGEVDHAPLFAPTPEVFSLVHVDYRLDNLMIHPVDSGYEITVVDWQSITLGAPLNDVAYFLGAGLLSDERLRVEEQIVLDYYQGLLAEGVSNFSWDDCWTGYRRGAFAGFGVTVVASMLVQQTERGDQMFTTMARRHARQALDLQADEFLF